MAILRLRDYAADVEVLGTVMRAEYHEEGGRLILNGCDIGFAGRILERLAVGTVRSVEQDTHEPDGFAVVAAATDKVLAIKSLRETTGKSMVACKEALEKCDWHPGRALMLLQHDALACPAPAHVDATPPLHKPQSPAAPPSPPAAEEPPVAPVVDMLTFSGGGAAKVEAVPPEVAAPVEPKPLARITPETVAPAAVAPAAKGEGHGLPDELLQARKLRDVLVFFETTGVKGADALVEACRSVQSTVPLLARITNLDERVRRTFEVMNGGTGA